MINLEKQNLEKISSQFETNLKFESFLKLFDLRKNDLNEYFLSKTKNLMQTNLKDFDWSLNVTIHFIYRLNKY